MTPPVVATVWAHYDDDLIFANPTIADALAGGARVRSLFLTASDAGKGVSEYATARETGIRAAYDVMLGGTAAWGEHVETLPNGVTLTVTAPDGDPRAALAFLRLPDGGLSGGGWFPTGYATLPKLLRGELASIATLDTGQELTTDLLVSTIAAFVAASGASTVITNLPAWAEGADGDHPDHGGTGALVAAAVGAGLVDGAMVRYAVGYPGAEREANVDGGRLARKLEVFAAYGEHDGVVASAPDAYLALRGFGDWLQREHLVPHDALVQAGAGGGAG